MKKLSMTLLALALGSVCATTASAAVLNLVEKATYKDGAVVDTFPNVTFTGTQSFSLTFSGTGAHNAIGFVDAEIDQAINTFFNEYGATNGSPAADQSWEIDEPDYVFGDIVANFSAGVLDNSNGVPAGSEDDVAMALGWDFSLAAGETATVEFFLSEFVPNSSFYLIQTDPDSVATGAAPVPKSLYFYSTLTIEQGGPTPAPEPSTYALLGIALAGMLAVRRKSARV